ncbi:MAG: hypothetical protein ACJ8LI_00530 [Chthoniobacterales bacterium]
MSDEVVIITPELSEGAGGLADYTLRLLHEWRGSEHFRFLLPEAAPASSVHEIEFVSRDAGALRKKLPTNDGRVLLQYSAYGFDRRGHPRWLLRELVDWKTRTGGLLVVMFHEIWTFRPVLNKDYLVQQLHRHAISKLIRVADAVFTSTTDQAGHLRELDPDCPVQVLPVGSNIPAPAMLPQTREAGVAVSFGLQSSRVRDLRALRDDLKALATAKVVRKVITCGAGESPDELAILSELPFSDGYEQRGPLPPDQISATLGRATFALSAQDPLSLQKSGTFMAYASHGLSIISPHAESLGAEPLCWLVRPRELLEGIDATELKRRAESLRDWQQRTASWPEIAARIAQALQMKTP